MARKKEMAAEPTQEVVIAYKGFDPNWQCRGYQYKVGDTFKHDGDVQACSSGFHACEFPLDVLGYYAPVDDRGVLNRFALVECTGTLSRHGDDSKIAAAQLTVKAEIKIPELISYAVKWILDRADSTKAASEERSLATNTGYQSAATNTGYRSAATNTGDRSAATNTGDYSAATNTGYQSAATNTGYRSAATAEGKHSVAGSFGYQGKAKAAAGCAIFLVYRNEDYEILHARGGVAGRDVKADTWYSLDANGEFVEVK